MKAFILTIVAIIGFTAAASAQTVETLTVALGRQKTASKSGLRIRYDKLVEDSRCPANAKCVWAGNAKIKISVSRHGEERRTFEMSTNLDPHAITVFGYEIKLKDVAPYPALEKKEVGGKLILVPKAATFTITKIRPRSPKQ